ncbi:MAG: VIT1/CCC1 transporter family protein [Microthrixaceae bacterium]
MRTRHLRPELHRSSRTGWLRASVLGANDGILSTGALLLGVAGAGASRSALLTAGVAGLTAGAMSMGIGEYVSVSTQADTERADRAMEEAELAEDPVAETAELRNIYESRGLPRELAQQVADTLMATDPLGAHLRDELGLSEMHAARPLQAALSSLASFALGAAIPLLVAVLIPAGGRALAIAAATVVGMVLLGAVGAALGGADRWRGALRVGVGGTAALALTYGIGLLFGTAVS